MPSSSLSSIAIVTGGAGFLGSHLCDRLLAEGRYSRVIALDNLVTGSLSNIAHLSRDVNFEYRHVDVSEPFAASLIEPGTKIDTVFHLACPASPEDYLRMPLETMKSCSYGTHNALDLARLSRSRFVLASTSEVYGDPVVHPQPEEYWGNVNSYGSRACYDEAKRYAEACVYSYRGLYGIDTKIARIFNTYGPRMRVQDGRVIPAFLSQALTGIPLTIYGDGSQTRSFCYVSDLIDGIYKLSQSDEEGPINIGNPTERTMVALAREILTMTGSGSSICHVPLKTADDPKQRRPDITKATQRLGWTPYVSLPQGLSATIPYFEQMLAVSSRPNAVAI